MYANDPVQDAEAELPGELVRILSEARRLDKQVGWSLEHRAGAPWLRLMAWPAALPGEGLGGELRRFCEREGIPPHFDVVSPRVRIPWPTGVPLASPRPVTDEHLQRILEEAQRLRPRGGFTYQVIRKGEVASLVFEHPPGPSEPSRWLYRRLVEFCDREGIPRAVICVAHPPPSLRLSDHPVPDGWPAEAAGSEGQPPAETDPGT